MNSNPNFDVLTDLYLRARWALDVADDQRLRHALAGFVTAFEAEVQADRHAVRRQKDGHPGVGLRDHRPG